MSQISRRFCPPLRLRLSAVARSYFINTSVSSTASIFANRGLNCGLPGIRSLSGTSEGESDPSSIGKETEAPPYGGAHPIWLEDDGAHTHKLVEWYKEAGDPIELEDSLCEIETDSFSYDILAPISGYLAKRCQTEESMLTDESLVALVVADEKEMENFLNFEETERLALAEADGLTGVGEWLAALSSESQLDQYKDTLQDEGFDSLKALKTLTDDDLKELGVKMGHRRIILEALQEEEEEKEGNGQH